MKKQDIKLFFSLMCWFLVPSIYMLFRMNILQIHSVDINILGQLEWFDLIDEVIVTTLTVPLYSVLKKNGLLKEKNTFALLISFLIYFLFTIGISAYIYQISEFMNAKYAFHYLKLQSFSMLVGYISSFIIILYTLKNSYKVVAALTVGRIVFLIITDVIFIRIFLEKGAAYSEIFSNTLFAIFALLLAIKSNLLGGDLRKIFSKNDFKWLKDYIKSGGFVAIQIFLDNYIYAIMICKMVNSVSEAGNYWVANNFIWGWLLIPVMCVSEIIKKNNYTELKFNNVWKYGLYILVGWFISFPLWRWFIENAMASDCEVILKILYPLVPFYITYVYSAFIDAWFVSKGKTYYNMINSVLCNIVYYGIAYVLFKQGMFETNMMFIIYLFGYGMVFHLICSYLLYRLEKKRKGSLAP